MTAAKASLVCGLCILGGTPQDDVRTLTSVCEALQHAVQDFQFEYEGAIRFDPAGSAPPPPRETDVAETFSGLYIWKSGGDYYCDSYHARAAGRGVRERRTLVVRTSENRAELLYRRNDRGVGHSTIDLPSRINAFGPGRPGEIFLVEKLKLILGEPDHIISVSDELLDQTPCKVVHIAIRTTEEILVARYWIDLKKNGHGVRAETYTRDKGIGSRLDVELAQFDVGTESVWFPVAGTLKTYVRRVHSDIEKTHEPVSIHKISILQDTLEFNKHPDPRVFTITHSPGTDISDRLKKVQYEFGQQKISNRPTKAEAEGMLREQLKRADEQKRQLVALPPEESSWVALMPWALGALLAVALLILRVTRHGR